MEIQYTTNPIVNEVGKMHFSGNIVPEIWFHTITNVKKTTLPLVVLILAEIVYWYRPSEVRDEAGQFITYKKKFYDNDYLQMSYEQFAQKYQISKGQAKAAIVALEDIGVIKRHFRTVTSKTGLKSNNVMYIELIPAVLHKLTYADSPPMKINPHTSTDRNAEVHLSNNTSIVPDNDTNTNITTNTTTEDFILSFEETEGKPSSYDDIKDSFYNYVELYPDECKNANVLLSIKNHYGLNSIQLKELATIQVQSFVNYDDLIIDSSDCKDLIDSIIDIATDIITDNYSTTTHSMLIGSDTTIKQSKIYSLDMFAVKGIIKRFSEVADSVKNKRSYLTKMLLNGKTDCCLNDRYYG